MAVTASDIIAYSCLNKPSVDIRTGVGGIGTNFSPVFTQIASTDDIEAVSSSNSDVSDLTIIGRDAAGVIVTAVITMSGVISTPTSQQFSCIFSVSYATTAIGSISVRRFPSGATICIIPSGEKGVAALFKGATSQSGSTTRYDKFYWKNVHASTSLTGGLARITADPDARIRQGIATAVNDTATIANRTTAPAGITFVDDNVDQAIPGGGTLAAGSAVGVWVEMVLPAADVEHKTTFTMQIAGS